MADADEESEVFEITDFTTASEWERFIARLEEVIHEWKLDETASRHPPASKGADDREGVWAFVQDQVSFASFSFNISYHYLKRKSKGRRASKDISEVQEGMSSSVMEMFDMDFDFPPRVHCLSRWYGLKELIVLSPSQNVECIDNESRCHLLLSSISIAFNNSKCTIPMFIQAHQRWRRLYYGICLGGEFRTMFEMCHLKHTPPQYNHLSGLLEVFKDKSACPISPCPPVTVSIRFTYVLNEWTDYSWPKKPPDAGQDCDTLDQLGCLPFGATQDPINELHLSTTWPCLSEEVVVDNSVYSDLDPLQAPEWSVRVRMSENPSCLLGNHLNGFMELCHRQETMMQLLLRNSSNEWEDNADITQALQRLTDPGHGSPVSSLSLAVSKATTKISSLGEVSSEEFPIEQNLLNRILKHLFPDAEEDVELIEAKQQEVQDSRQDQYDTSFKDLQEQLRGLKSAPEDSLTFSLAVCICNIYNNYGGLRAVAHLWHEFVLEMRYRWENDIFLPRLHLESPNLGCCIIHQKLQMLNCCIERRRLSRIRSSKVNVRAKTPESSESEDEFFEALEDLESQSPCKVSSEENLPVDGRLRQFNDLTLLISGEPLYIPVTQEPAPMTEDMLQEHAEVLTQLGTTQEGARVRAQMQSASLLSDMEAFKAANPGCLLEDFVRWYSPNDWITGKETREEEEELANIQHLRNEETPKDNDKDDLEDSTTSGWEDMDDVTEEELKEVEKSAAAELIHEAKAGHVPQLSSKRWSEEGHLSLRMRIPGNMWSEVWQSAKAVPIRRQKRLFDETKEAEKVLHFLASLKPADLAFYLFPVIVHASLVKIEEAGGKNIPAVSSLLDQVKKTARQIHWTLPDDLPQCEELTRQLTLAELVIARADSLHFKFQEAIESQKSSVQKIGGEKNLHEFLDSLMEKPEVNVVGAGRGPAGRVIHKLFAKQENLRMEEPVIEKNTKEHHASIQDFPLPAGREYILRTTFPRPARSSRPCPQRMYCVLTGDEFRLAGAFTEDTTFQ